MKYEDLRFAVDDFLRKAIMPSFPFWQRALIALQIPQYVIDHEATAIEFLKKNKLMSEDGIVDYKEIQSRLESYLFCDKETTPVNILGKEFVIRKEHINEILNKAITLSTQA